MVSDVMILIKLDQNKSPNRKAMTILRTLAKVRPSVMQKPVESLIDGHFLQPGYKKIVYIKKAVRNLSLCYHTVYSNCRKQYPGYIVYYLCVCVHRKFLHC